MAACSRDVVILGYSFIRRLRDFVESSEVNDNLRLSRCNISVPFYARGGLTIDRLTNSPELISFPSSKDICFLQIGSTDLFDRTKSIGEISTAIISFANFLIFWGKTKKLIIGQILRRSPRVIYPLYNDIVFLLNMRLQSLCNDADNIHFWHHTGFWDSFSFLAADDVHLQHPSMDARPMMKYLQSLKSAILHFSRWSDKYKHWCIIFPEMSAVYYLVNWSYGMTTWDFSFSILFACYFNFLNSYAMYLL